MKKKKKAICEGLCTLNASLNRNLVFIEGQKVDGPLPQRQILQKKILAHFQDKLQKTKKKDTA